MEKCTKYEELFIKEDESELIEHIKTCPQCQKEQERMEKVSAAIKEVSFIIRRKRQLEKKIMTIAASFAIFALAFFSIQYNNQNSFINDVIASIGTDYTYEQMGLPVDDYGLIMVDSDY